MTSAPPDLSRLRIDRSEPARPSSGGRGRGLAIGVILVLIALAALAWVPRAPRLRDAAAARRSQLEIERDQAARDLARIQTLHDQHVVADAELEDRAAQHHSLEAQVESAKAQLEVARANLENTLVRAPFDGTVLRKDA